MVKQALQDPGDRSPEQERGDLLSFALFCWESAVTIALTLILIILVPDPFHGTLSFWRWWFWIALGVLAEALIVVTTVSDPGVRARMTSNRVRARFDVGGIVDADYRHQIEHALELLEQMEVVMQRTREPVPRERLQATVDDVSQWIDVMFRLARRLDGVRDHTLRGPGLLEMVTEAESQLDASLSALETTYAQVQLRAAGGVNERQVRQLRSTIAGHVQHLEDVRRRIEVASGEAELRDSVSRGTGHSTSKS